MKQTADNYGRALWELGVKKEAVEVSEELLKDEKALFDVLKNPTISQTEKEQVIERLFPEEMKSFFKVLCHYKRAALFPEIAEAFRAYEREQRGVLRVVLTCVTPPTGAQLSGLSEFLKRRFGKKSVEFEIRQDISLIGGFILKAGAFEYDRSLKGKYRRLSGYLYGGERS